MPIKTFRGLIADGLQDIITLHTNDGSVGYRLIKFELMPNTPGTGSAQESIVQIFKTAQTVITGTVDFSDQTLLGVAVWIGNKNPAASVPSPYSDVIFDREIFNQDIFVTHIDTDGSEAVNYYIELEQIKLDLNENTVATLKDIRNLA
jgi:hypothetical protein